MKDKTFDEWKQLGYTVIKGQRSHCRNKFNKPTFTRDQVEETEDFDRQNDLKFERE
jgi:hypothetical protein